MSRPAGAYEAGVYYYSSPAGAHFGLAGRFLMGECKPTGKDSGTFEVRVLGWPKGDVPGRTLRGSYTGRRFSFSDETPEEKGAVRRTVYTWVDSPDSKEIKGTSFVVISRNQNGGNRDIILNRLRFLMRWEAR
jgi:hypothetical protein